MLVACAWQAFEVDCQCGDMEKRRAIVLSVRGKAIRVGSRVILIPSTEPVTNTETSVTDQVKASLRAFSEVSYIQNKT